MKNPANPGDFGTNGIRGVVPSGMGETTNSADWPIGVSVSITQTCGKPASEFEMLTYAWYALGAKMRAAEGCVGDFTPTRSGNVGTASEAQTSTLDEECGCDRCQSSRPGFPGPSKPGWRYACEQCGNKRCPHHEWHGFECTGSNEPGQIGVERSEERETTNSPAEIEAGCTGRKSALKLWWFWVALAVFALPGIYLFGMVEGLLLYIPCVVAGCLLAEFWVLPLIETWRTAKQRASGGEGV